MYSKGFLYQFSFDGIILQYQSKSLLRLWNWMTGNVGSFCYPSNAILLYKSKPGRFYTEMELFLYKHSLLKINQLTNYRIIHFTVPNKVAFQIEEEIRRTIRLNLTGRNFMLYDISDSEIKRFYKIHYPKYNLSADTFPITTVSNQELLYAWKY